VNFSTTGIWDFSKGNTVKSTFVIENGCLRNVEVKNNKYCIKRRVKGQVTWEELYPQPDDDTVVILSRYYATLKSDPDFKKRVSYFVKKNDSGISSIALYEYQGNHQSLAASHGNRRGEKHFVRTHPRTFDKIKERMKEQIPRDIYRELKKDDSMTGARDTRLISNVKYNEKRKSANKRNQANVADDILEVLGMINEHPFVQTIIHNKEQVPSIICYTQDQITDLQHFLTHGYKQPVGIDRTFNLGNFYVMTLVYKNQRVV